LKSFIFQKNFTRVWIAVFVILFGCASYYKSNIKFQKHFEEGNLEKAAEILEKQKKTAEGKDRLLHFLSSGVVYQMLGEYGKSNDYFEKAYIYLEDFQKNYTLEAFSLLTNPMIKAYSGEDFETVLIHYYKALNYLQMAQFDEALVECRRINIKLNKLNDRYSKYKNRYKEDAFALNLMGIIYEASGEINDAFIAYRNAYKTYVNEYVSLFGVHPPEQLKKDLLRTAYLNGFKEELSKFEQDFGVNYEPQQVADGELIFFWHNGLGPVKDEWSINFAIVKGEGGIVNFVNQDAGFAFAYNTNNYHRNKSTDFGDLKAIRVAFPKYVTRQPYYDSAEIISGGKTYQLELAENVNDIAYKTLEDRMMREFSTALIRLAVKQLTEELVRKENENLGTILSLFNAATEKADTRNWQTLPFSISYARVPLKEGQNTVELMNYSSRGEGSEINFQFEVVKGQTLFHVFHALESLPIRNTALYN
jgi:hypothetical protein